MIVIFAFNYGDTRGQITKLLAGARITYPERYPELKDTTLSQVKGRLPLRVNEYIRDQVTKDFPDMDLFYSNSLKGQERLGQLLYE